MVNFIEIKNGRVVRGYESPSEHSRMPKKYKDSRVRQVTQAQANALRAVMYNVDRLKTLRDDAGEIALLVRLIEMDKEIR